MNMDYLQTRDALYETRLDPNELLKTLQKIQKGDFSVEIPKVIYTRCNFYKIEIHSKRDCLA